VAGFRVGWRPPMSAADCIDPELRAGVRSARSLGIRCIKAVVKSKKKLGHEANKQAEQGIDNTKKEELAEVERAELCLSVTVHEDPKVNNLEKEFARCASATLEEKKPCLVLFRTDGEENIEGCRWILLTWIPTGCTEAERAMYIRSRGVFLSLAQQPYFLHEVFARSKKDLAWPNISQYIIQNEAAKLAVHTPTCFVNEHQPSGPLVLSPQVEPILQRLARREDPCVRLQLLGSKLPIKWTGAPGNALPTMLTLDGKAHECKGAAFLAKSVLPSAACYFATLSNNILFFVSWCPDTSMKKDMLRLLEEARYAVMRSVVLGFVTKAFAKSPQPARVVQISARDPQEIQDAIFKATDLAADSANLSAQAKEGSQKPWPIAGAPADFPTDWPAAAFPSTMPSTLHLPERLVAPWRGGGKTHTIGGGPDGVGGTTSTSRARKSIRYSHNH